MEWADGPWSLALQASQLSQSDLIFPPLHTRTLDSELFHRQSPTVSCCWKEHRLAASHREQLSDCEEHSAGVLQVRETVLV